MSMQGSAPTSTRPVATTTSTTTSVSLAFLFTDIEGSTRLWEAHPQAMDAALARHDTLLSEQVAVHGGHVFKTVGDAFCTVFKSPRKALYAALSIQRAIRAEPWPDDTPIRVRMAVHAGPAIRRDDDYFGTALNRTARILGLAFGGQVLVSDAAREGAGELPPECALSDLGAFRLRDVAQAARLYQLVHPDLPADFPPLRSLDSLPTNLPILHGEFIGRGLAVAEVRQRVAGSPLVTLTGPGGIGKTRLALQVGAEELDAFPDGVWFVDLAPVTDEQVVIATVARVLGLREEVGRPLSVTVAAWLQSRRLLLILDNAEHVLDETARLASVILAASAGVHLLVTSREPLNIGSETVWSVPPLGRAGGRARGLIDLAEIVADDAVQLFAARAAAVKPDFILDDANAAPIAALCRRLDGIPLAIELAAARVNVLSPAAILARLDDRFRLLTGGRRDAMPRHQTLRATLDWSHDLLSGGERTLLARLSVFRADWTLESAEAVCADETIDALDVLDLVARLVERSLVVLTGDEADSRYRLLETVRHYAAEKLVDFEMEEAVRGRHLAWCQDIAAAANAAMRGRDQAASIERLEGQHDDLRSAMDWAAGIRDAASVLRLCAQLWRFWHARGHLTEGRSRLVAALEQSAAAGAGIDIATRAEALHGAATLAGLQGDNRAARALHEESLAIRRALGDLPGEAASLNNLAIIAYQEGDFVAARHLYDNSLTLKRELNDVRGIANTLTNIALIAKSAGDLVEAAAMSDESLALFRHLDDAAGEAQSLMNIAPIAAERGEFDRARALLEESLGLSRTLGDPRRIALIHYLQALVEYNDGHLERAREYCEASLNLEREMDNAHGLNHCLVLLGRIAFAEGDGRSARELLELGLAGLETARDKHGHAEALLGLGIVQRADGDLDAALDSLQRSLELFAAMGQKIGLLYAFESLAGIAVDAGRPGPALSLLAAADATRAKLDAPAERIAAQWIEQDRSLARNTLGPQAAERAWAEGRRLDLEGALAIARAMARPTH